jgi:hypothetical protein
MGSVFVGSAISDDERRARLYAGDIFILPPTAGTRGMIGLARQMLEDAFAPHDPRKIHEKKSAEEVAAILGKLKPQFIHHPECKKFILQVMQEHGVDTDKLYFDVPRLRSAYPSWWIPVYPLDPNNAMGFYPRYFKEAVKNNSEIYNYYEWNTKNRATAAQHVKSDTREQPKAQQELEPVTVRYLPEPGGIIIFSGAQLHETVPNTTDSARYSIDFRTVHYDDVIQRRGAPNVDSRCTGTTMRDYLRANDLSHLPEEAITLYDDGTAVEGRVLYFGDKLLSEVKT